MCSSPMSASSCRTARASGGEASQPSTWRHDVPRTGPAVMESNQVLTAERVGGPLHAPGLVWPLSLLCLPSLLTCADPLQV